MYLSAVWLCLFALNTVGREKSDPSTWQGCSDLTTAAAPLSVYQTKTYLTKRKNYFWSTQGNILSLNLFFFYIIYSYMSYT